MRGLPIAEHVAAAADLRALARALGRFCLEHENEIADRRWKHPTLKPAIFDLAGAVAAWPGWDEERELLKLLEEEAVASRVELLANVGLAEVGVLRGLCMGPLNDHFLAEHGTVELELGDPYPLPDRPVQRIGGVTPHWSTLDETQALVGTGFRLWRRLTGSAPRVLLDFSRREDLDRATWCEHDGRGLPTVASIHPYASFDEQEIAEHHADWWFGVRPLDFQDDRVLSALADARADGADVAVLPELAFPEPDRLERAIAADHGRFPPLVVCGSAHVRHDAGAEIRANEVHAYLAGRRLVRHRKIHPYIATFKDAEGDARRVPEGITGEAKDLVLPSGTNTRLGVVICADLNDQDLVGVLVAAGVNALLVPSLTAKPGAFAGVATSIASFCQGIAVIVNGAPPLAEGAPDPFLLIAAVPRADPDDQIAAYAAPAWGRRGRGQIDLDRPLPAEADWSEI